MILVIDLEATCDEGDGIPPDEMEIIEIGAVWADRTGLIVDEFQSFVRPVVSPTLTAFCTRLTTITQADVEAAEAFQEVAKRLAAFAQRHASTASVWGSWGNYDKNQFRRDCIRHGTEDPLQGFDHVNLKRTFAKKRRIREVGIARALKILGLPMEGAHHRGIDDARNIAKMLPWCLPDVQSAESTD